MQRKRNRVQFTDNIELGVGTNILPVSKGLMRKLKMKSLLKYVIVGIICFTAFSFYQKIELLSKDSIREATRRLTVNDGFMDAFQDPDNDNRRADTVMEQKIDRRVKEEINKVFEEFKEKQERAEREEQKAPDNPVADFHNEGMLQNDNDRLERNDLNEYDNLGNRLGNKFENQNGFDDAYERKDQVDNEFEMRENEKDDVNMVVDEQNVENNVVKDMGDHYEELIENVIDSINDDREQEQLEIEDEIEHRLAEVLKDAVNEVADEKAEQNELPVEDLDLYKKNDLVQEQEIKPLQVEVPEQKEFKVAVDQMDQKLNPMEMQRLNEKAIRDEQKKDDDHEFPPFVTAAGTRTYLEVTQLVASLQTNMPGKKIYIYDLDLSPDQKKHLMSYCGVRLRKFMKELFPEYVQNFSSLHWKPLVMQTALAEFGHMIWINPQYRLSTQNIGPLLHDSHETGITIVGQFASYTTYSATNPKMFQFLPSNKDKLANSPHIEIRAILIHNTPEVHENVMKLFTACALEQNCLAPPGSKWSCTFDFTGRKPAGCHRYDESAMNILLKNWFNFDLNKFARRNSYFRDFDQHYKPNLKLCRSVRDIRDNEL